MHTIPSLKSLWLRVISDFKKNHPKYSEALRLEKFKPIVVDNKANYYGQCDYRNKTVSVNIHLHRHSEEKYIVDTMLHEIAHAVDKCVHGVSSGHGKPWKKIALEIGCDPSSKKNVSKKVEYKYVMGLQTEDSLEFIRGYNRRPSRTPIKSFLIGWAVGEGDRKDYSRDRLIVYPWRDWKVVCDKYKVGYYREDHK